MTSKSEPERHIELNEQRVFEGGPETAAYGGLNERQTFTYPNGQKQWDVTYKAGRKTGVETWWSDSGRKQWERTWADDGTWTCRLCDDAGRVTAESRWNGKDLLDANAGGSLPR